MGEVSASWIVPIDPHNQSQMDVNQGCSEKDVVTSEGDVLVSDVIIKQKKDERDDLLTGNGITSEAINYKVVVEDLGDLRNIGQCEKFIGSPSNSPELRAHEASIRIFPDSLVPSLSFGSVRGSTNSTGLAIDLEKDGPFDCSSVSTKPTEVLDRFEKLGGVPKDWKLLSGFRETLDDCGLDDSGYNGPQFTWCNKIEGADLIHGRLDRCTVLWLLVRLLGKVVSNSRSVGLIIGECRELISSVWIDRRALESEERYWRQRSRIDWLKYGDRNTHFFHMTSSVRRAHNNISGLRGDDEEIKKSVFELGATKAPGKDGLHALFYQQYWDNVGSSVVKACLECLNDGNLMVKMNDTPVTLIPKKKLTERIMDFRPINLSNVLYKIVSKSIANRLRLVLDGVIIEAQSAFIPRRLISDNILVSFECMHRIKRRKRRRGPMASKLDMSKAYDMVEWIFIEKMMRKLGFFERWISLVIRCISSISYSFILNGDICDRINPSHGLRHGDPLSPYLFLFCAEGFSSLATIFNCVSIRRILDIYARASGQIINFDKSAMCVSPSVPSQECIRMVAIIGIGVVECHERALLANQCWRIMKNGNSLAACVLKACYFPEGNFIDAKGKSTASFIWKSLMWGKAIIVAEADVSAILSISIGRHRWPDSLQWHFDQNGSYSTKSGYWLGCPLRSAAGSSDSSLFFNNSSSWSTSLWKLQIPYKVKIFVWKACNNLLPCFEVLARHKIPVARIYPMYKCKNESILHGLWSCSSLKLVRVFWFPKLAANHKDKSYFFDFMLNCFSRLKLEDLRLFYMCLWKIWSIRNDDVHGLALVREVDVVDWSRGFIDECQSGSVVKSKSLISNYFRNPLWIPHDLGLYKINCDAAIDVIGRLVGFGIVIRDS
ncbi:hypothetical protein Dsin_024780 [Dipteronia sinensis]|uniref:Reverse transcriptase domain-containing protein n=1 Tax=Dipteronia sinensis TaxID=43782 RepID=A0AAE0DW78_9ROSI|nr:hypothetical protein Dsin_024780 [Dipteronia sinensis]